MKLHAFQKLLFAAILASPFAHAAPILEQRDFSDDQRNFHQIIQLLHNMRSRIGLPFSGMINVGLNYPGTVEINPIDLALLPGGYCFSCDTRNVVPDMSKRPNPMSNDMVEIDEQQIIMLCAQADDEHGFEWPLIQLCPAQKDILLDFLTRLRKRGNRIAVPKDRVLSAPLVRLGERKCMPKNGHKTCAPMPTPKPVGHTGKAPKTRKGKNKTTSLPMFEQYAESFYSEARRIATASSSTSASKAKHRKPGKPLKAPKSTMSNPKTVSAVQSGESLKTTKSTRSYPTTVSTSKPEKSLTAPKSILSMTTTVTARSTSSSMKISPLKDSTTRNPLLSMAPVHSKTTVHHHAEPTSTIVPQNVPAYPYESYWASIQSKLEEWIRNFPQLGPENIQKIDTTSKALVSQVTNSAVSSSSADHIPEKTKSFLTSTLPTLNSMHSPSKTSTKESKMKTPFPLSSVSISSHSESETSPSTSLAPGVISALNVGDSSSAFPHLITMTTVTTSVVLSPQSTEWYTTTTCITAVDPESTSSPPNPRINHAIQSDLMAKFGYLVNDFLSSSPAPNDS